MNTLEINVVYPFWVKSPYLMHSFDRGERMRFLSQWIDTVRKPWNNSDKTGIQDRLDKQEANRIAKWEAERSRTAHEKDEMQKLKESWTCRYKNAHALLSSMTWSLRDFRYQEKDQNCDANIPNSQVRLLPVQISNHKGGVMRGHRELLMPEYNAKDVSKFATDLLDADADFHKAQQKEWELQVKDNDLSVRVFNAIKSLFSSHFTASVDELKLPKEMFSLQKIDIDIIYYDWNLGLLEFTYKIVSDSRLEEIAQMIGPLSQKLHSLFSKNYLKIDDKADNSDNSERKERSELFKCILPDNQRNAGYIHPRYRVLEDWIRLLKRCAPYDMMPTGGRILRPVVDDIFTIQLKPANINHNIPKLDEDFRMPFTGINVFIGTNESGCQGTMSHAWTRAMQLFSGRSIGDNTNGAMPPISSILAAKMIGKDGALEVNPQLPYMLQVASGYNGNLLIHNRDLNNNQKQEVFRLWYIWRLGMIYYSGLLRIQSHLIARMGLQLPLHNLKAGENALKEDSIYAEVERLEALQLAIEAVIQESLPNNIGDDDFLRSVYRCIRDEYRMDDLIAAVRLPIPKLTADLRAIGANFTKTREMKRLRISSTLNSLVLFSTMFSAVSLFYGFSGMPKVFEWEFLKCNSTGAKFFLAFIIAFTTLVVYTLTTRHILKSQGENSKSLRNILDVFYDRADDNGEDTSSQSESKISKWITGILNFFGFK